MNRPIGVYQARNQSDERVFIGSTLNLQVIFNRHRFQLEMGGQSDRPLQEDWDWPDGRDFAFEVVEELLPRETADVHFAADLEFLEDLWIEKLEPYGENGYNEPKKSLEERLHMIAANRRRSEDSEQ